MVDTKRMRDAGEKSDQYGRTRVQQNLTKALLKHTCTMIILSSIFQPREQLLKLW